MQSVKCIFNFVYCVFLPYLDQWVSITVEKGTKRTLNAISASYFFCCGTICSSIEVKVENWLLLLLLLISSSCTLDCHPALQHFIRNQQTPTEAIPHFLQLQVKCFAFVFHFLPCDFAQRNNTPGVSSKLFSAVLLLSLHYCHLLCGSFDQIIIGTAYFDDIIICRYDISTKYSSFFCAYFLK